MAPLGVVHLVPVQTSGFADARASPPTALTVAVVDRDPPLRRLLGTWLAIVRANGEVTGRCPHWTNAVAQGQTAARALLRGEAAPALSPDPYFWTEQFGLEIKISGRVPAEAAPAVLAGPPIGGRCCSSGPAGPTRGGGAVNYRVPVVKLKKLGARAPATT